MFDGAVLPTLISGLATKVRYQFGKLKIF